MEDVVILAGGAGTRLRPYTTVLPKPLMPVGDMPVLEILLRRLAASGFERVNLAVGHLAELIEAYFGDGRRFGLDLVYWREPEPLGTAGPLMSMELTADRALVMNGDLLTTLAFTSLLEDHAASGAAATIAVLGREVPIDFGVVHLDGDRVAEFEEKPVLTYDVSMGVYVFERRVVDLIPPGTRYDFPDLLRTVLENGWPVHAYRSTDFWLDIGRIDDYELALERFPELRADLLRNE
ncbi:MAG TPA: sugar phosphate nucleotidyltransferase [Candidatus Limnocylindrales bacterium]|nr:sugar phosphate nucleotidyltransferase [Candidatus Limnocylindrales bacterium]